MYVCIAVPNILLLKLDFPLSSKMAPGNYSAMKAILRCISTGTVLVKFLCSDMWIGELCTNDTNNDDDAQSMIV